MFLCKINVKCKIHVVITNNEISYQRFLDLSTQTFEDESGLLHHPVQQTPSLVSWSRVDLHLVSTWRKNAVSTSQVKHWFGAGTSFIAVWIKFGKMRFFAVILVWVACGYRLCRHAFRHAMFFAHLFMPSTF